jgi:hypothetical protein
MSHRFMIFALAIALAPGITIAEAKDICVADSFGPDVIVFKKVKLPKPPKPGKSIKPRIAPLTGFVMVTVNGTNAGPIHGSAIVKSDGAIRAAVVGQGLAALGFTTDVVFESMNVNAGLSGSGIYSYPGKAATASTWTPIDCGTVTLP